uniref:Glycosyltransferase 2-like domain-containing protein n=1 Tax=Araucaria cunninghamii TaxID=56994 RepID=A0A0D6QSW0_ARACU
MEPCDSSLYTTVVKPHAKKNRAYACIYLAAIVGLIYYRILFMPSESYIPWILGFAAELGFAFRWTLDQAMRWRPVDRFTFPERLSRRFERDLPSIDIFICTADPIKEPPISVVNTVLSTLAFDYPAEKLSCYLSDDGGSPLTFYALLEASRFAKMWVPFCNKYSLQQRCPEAYFAEGYARDNENLSFIREWKNVNKTYKEMKSCINNSVERGTVPEDKRGGHIGFRDWSSEMNSRDHPTIIQVLLEKGRDMDAEGHDLPNLVYVSREKKPGFPHYFKAGALNALIRVSEVMTNSPFMLTLDCDMYANNCEALREAMCFFMDPKSGHQFGYVQFPQRFHGITKNDLYANSLKSIFDIQAKGLDGFEGPEYVGTGCVHRRDVLCGSDPQYPSSKLITAFTPSKLSLKQTSPSQRLDDARALANCTYEENTLWGKKVGMLYNSAVEDILTGLVIHYRGWKSALCVPQRDAFLGCAPCNLNDTLIQHKRWTTGQFEIFASRYCPLVRGIGTTSIAHRMGCTFFCLWAPSSLHILCYSLVPALCMLSGLSMFPEISSPWFLLFVFLSVTAHTRNAIELVWIGYSFKGWWNEQRMWMIKGVSSYLFGLIQVICKLTGISKVGFELTDKVYDRQAGKRYEEENFEFGVASTLFVPPATVALINLISLLGGITQVIRQGYECFESMFVQLVLSSFIVINSYPIYEGMFVRKDKGRMPTTITLFSVVAAMVACSLAPLIL